MQPSTKPLAESEKEQFLDRKMLVNSAFGVIQFEPKRGQMTKSTKSADQSGVDKTLIAMFIKMSPEDRLRANDNAYRTILELRDAYRRRKPNKRKPK